MTLLVCIHPPGPVRVFCLSVDEFVAVTPTHKFIASPSFLRRNTVSSTSSNEVTTTTTLTTFEQEAQPRSENGGIVNSEKPHPRTRPVQRGGILVLLGDHEATAPTIQGSEASGKRNWRSFGTTAERNWRSFGTTAERNWRSFGTTAMHQFRSRGTDRADREKHACREETADSGEKLATTRNAKKPRGPNQPFAFGSRRSPERRTRPPGGSSRSRGTEFRPGGSSP